MGNDYDKDDGGYGVPTILWIARITLNIIERRRDGWCRAPAAMAYTYSL